MDIIKFNYYVCVFDDSVIVTDVILHRCRPQPVQRQQSQKFAVRQFIKYNKIYLCLCYRKDTKCRSRSLTMRLKKRKRANETRGRSRKEKRNLCAHREKNTHSTIGTRPFRILSDLFKRMECSANDLALMLLSGYCAFLRHVDMFRFVATRSPSKSKCELYNSIFSLAFVFFLFYFYFAHRKKLHCILLMSRFGIGRRAIANILNVLDSFGSCRRPMCHAESKVKLNREKTIKRIGANTWRALSADIIFDSDCRALIGSVLVSEHDQMESCARVHHHRTVIVQHFCHFESINCFTFCVRCAASASPCVLKSNEKP